MRRDNENLEWNAFVARQKEEILKRLHKYNNKETIAGQFEDIHDLTPYQKYKITEVSKFLIRSLQKIENNTYGFCDVCEQEIPLQGLKVVPGALTCVACDDRKEGL
ncbi:TraR/DksA C4-type zinc finger protein [Jiulongibacter sediminis]|uniref:TraR/DksA C4-type zinc finger protein n=1 Tax=Jiulongibacter sediminis TaxID=1605367 RepID=UPI0026F35304|nr:TraR/DksA C4-type zinc finger protein [Jiulongibacter sediminis]